MAMYMNQILKESIEIQLHPGIFNREADFILSQTWQQIISICSKQAAITA
jgi:hypothetical protein